MTAHPILLQMKYARVVALLAHDLNIPIEDALGKFYNSTTYQLVRQGISDMHCRTDQNLVDEIKAE